MRKEILVGYLALFLVMSLIGGWAWVIWRGSIPPHAAIEDSRLNEVKVGVTRAEVIATIGAEPGDYTGGSMFFIESEHYREHEYWIGSQRTLLVKFDEAQRASVVLCKSSFFRPKSSRYW